MGEFKRRSVNFDHDRMGRLMRENEELRKVNRRLSEELRIIKEELEECKELCTNKGIFALKVSFHNGWEEYNDKISAFGQFVNKELEELRGRVKKMEHELFVRRMVVRENYQKVRMSDSVEKLDKREETENQPKSEKFVFGRRRKIFEDFLTVMD